MPIARKRTGLHAAPSAATSGDAMQESIQKAQRIFMEAESVDRIDEHMGFQRYQAPVKRCGWLINVVSVGHCWPFPAQSCSSMALSVDPRA